MRNRSALMRPITILTFISLACGIFFVVSDTVRLDSFAEVANATIIVDTIISYRAAVMGLLILQLIGIVLLRNSIRYFYVATTSLVTFLVYAGWFMTTARTVQSLERPSYNSIEHFLFLGNGSLLDIVVLLCSIAVLTIALRWIWCSNSAIK